MKRLTLLLLAGLVAATAAADTRSSQLLAQLSASLRALGRYGVQFEIVSDDYHDAGRYVVEGERYYLRLGDAEVYCDGETRYEIDPAKREVVIDRVDRESRNLLNNPTRGFDFLDDEFVHHTTAERDGSATVVLTPSGASSPVEAISLTVDTASGLPRSVVYDFDGERIHLTIRRVAAEAEAPAAFSAAKYPDYEMIDFR